MIRMSIALAFSIVIASAIGTVPASAAQANARVSIMAAPADSPAVRLAQVTKNGKKDKKSSKPGSSSPAKKGKSKPPPKK